MNRNSSHSQSLVDCRNCWLGPRNLRTPDLHGKRPTSRQRPEWGARRPVPKAGLIPMMMPNGEMGYVVPEAWS